MTKCQGALTASDSLARNVVVSLSEVQAFSFHEGLSSFSEITKDSKTAEKMEELYKDINNIDLWVGGLAEDHESGSELGETFRT